jgi:hypothetical protein
MLKMPSEDLQALLEELREPEAVYCKDHAISLYLEDKEGSNDRTNN